MSLFTASVGHRFRASVSAADRLASSRPPREANTGFHRSRRREAAAVLCRYRLCFGRRLNAPTPRRFSRENATHVTPLLFYAARATTLARIPSPGRASPNAICFSCDVECR